MLEPVEILPGCRRTLRRGVSMDAELIASRWDRPRAHRVTDVSPLGLRVAAGTRLPVDEVVALSFVPPGWWLHGEVTVFSRVASSAPRHDGLSAWMGLEFLDLPAGVEAHLQRSLRGLPPPLPSRRSRHRKELVWVDMLVTYTEDLGDRVNTVEMSEVMKAVDEEELQVQSLGGLLTGGRRPYVWAA